MSDFLQQMAESSAARAAAIRAPFTAGALDRPAFPLVLTGFDLIAEIKDRSPAEGALASSGTSKAERAALYADGGAAAISVLTEPQRFDGDLAHLVEVTQAMTAKQVPVMRKDFLVATTQVLEAKAAGASGVLLIAAMLDDSELASMLDCAFEHDLFVLLESFDANDLERSAQVLKTAKVREQAGKNKFLLGINTRDLRTLAVDPLRLKKFAADLPTGVIAVAESGQRSAEDAAQVAAMGYRMALVGSALMRSGRPGELIKEMLTAGRNRLATS
jgi:indole-3-glycerol phosphate synthase